MKGLVFSRSAEADLADIDLQTIEQFGFAQADRTDAAFDSALCTLAAMPQSGHERPDLDPPGRTFRYRSVLGRFMIVYAPAIAPDQGIRVARIFDGARDLSTALRLDPGDDHD